jgi:hypothetical protein
MIEYRFRVPSAAVFTLYSYSKTLEYHLEYATAGSLTRLVVYYTGTSLTFTSVIGWIMVHGVFATSFSAEGSRNASEHWLVVSTKRKIHGDQAAAE